MMESVNTLIVCRLPSRLETRCRERSPYRQENRRWVKGNEARTVSRQRETGLELTRYNLSAKLASLPFNDKRFLLYRNGHRSPLTLDFLLL